MAQQVAELQVCVGVFYPAFGGVGRGVAHDGRVTAEAFLAHQVTCGWRLDALGGAAAAEGILIEGAAFEQELDDKAFARLRVPGFGHALTFVTGGHHGKQQLLFINGKVP